MPELPEVESTCRFLSDRIVGRTVCDVTVLRSSSIDRPSVAEFKRKIAGAQFLAVTRRGKFIVASLDSPARGGMSLLIHLRMSGSVDVLGSHHPRDQHDRVVLIFDNGKEMRFHDPRTFGRMYLVATPEEVTGVLGPEPIGASALSAGEFIARITQRRGRIKSHLLDQRLVAGLGNIYVDESLWRAGIHPQRAIPTVTPARLGRLYVAIQEVLKEAIAQAGTDYGDGVVAGGRYQPRVYGRAGEACPRCERIITRIVVGQRGTHLCRRCQR